MSLADEAMALALAGNRRAFGRLPELSGAPAMFRATLQAIARNWAVGSLTLVTGSIWAHISWGTWWDWGSRELNTFLIIFLFYCAYFMLRFSVEPGARRSRYSAVYALLGVGLIPLSVLAVRIAQDALHPIVFRSNGVNMDGSMFLTFCVALAAMLSLAVSMYLVEMRGKRVDERLAQLRRLAQEAA